jgi:pimeloyl-ACP methyl ester carboxylesterase
MASAAVGREALDSGTVRSAAVGSAAVSSATVVSEGTIVVAGASVRWRWQNEGRDPIVLLPGLGGDAARDFAFVQPMLARRRPVLALDLARLDGDGPALDVAALARATSAALELLVPAQRVTLVGYSLGAAVAATVASGSAGLAMADASAVATASVNSAPATSGSATLAPDDAARAVVEPSMHVAELVLIAPLLAPGPRQRDILTVWHALAAATTPAATTTTPGARDGANARAGALEAFARLLCFGGSSAGHDSPAEQEFVRSLTASRATEEHLGTLVTAEIRSTLPAIAVPTLVVGCTDDAVLEIDQARSVFATIPDARFAEIDSGHAVFVERPAEVLSLVEGFLDDPIASQGSRVPGVMP